MRRSKTSKTKQSPIQLNTYIVAQIQGGIMEQNEFTIHPPYLKIEAFNQESAVLKYNKLTNNHFWHGHVIGEVKDINGYPLLEITTNHRVSATFIFKLLQPNYLCTTMIRNKVGTMYKLATGYFFIETSNI